MAWDERMERASKVIFSFCRARTATYQDAEDLAQDVLLEVARSLPNLRDERAFYGFMWSVARNVYRQWLRKKQRRVEVAAELPEAVAPEEADDGADLYRLRREMALLKEQYRRVTILYYMRGLSCAAIAAELGLSESMVKYLLFKARKKLKEGMSMERNLGQQSYDPRCLDLCYWSDGPARYYPRKDEIISQNILFACMHDRLTAEEISLEIGVGLPYMQEDLEALEAYELLNRDGKRYTTNVMLFTREMIREIAVKSGDQRWRIAKVVKDAILTKEGAIRAIGFQGADMPGNTFAWQMTAILLFQAVIARVQEKVRLAYPTDKLGQRYFVWGVERAEHEAENSFFFGTAGYENARGDRLRCMDFPINGEMVHLYFTQYRDALMLLLDVAAGQTDGMSGIDELRAAEMVRRGYLRRDGERLAVNAPVFTRAQFDELLALLEPDAEAIADEARQLMDSVAEIVRNHIPPHLRDQAEAMACFRLMEDAISAPVALLFGHRFLLPTEQDSVLPTTYVVVNR